MEAVEAAGMLGAAAREVATAMEVPRAEREAAGTAVVATAAAVEMPAAALGAARRAREAGTEVRKVAEVVAAAAEERVVRLVALEPLAWREGTARAVAAGNACPAAVADAAAAAVP